MGISCRYVIKKCIALKTLLTILDLAVRRALFDSERRQEKTALASAKADFPSLPEYKNLLLAAQKQLLELPYCSTILRRLALCNHRQQKRYFRAAWCLKQVKVKT
jgi:hypothetical protein